MNIKKLVIIISLYLLLLACGLSAPPDWANYIITIDGTAHYAASYYWDGDKLSLVTAEKQVVTFDVGEGVTVEISEIVRDES